MLLIDPATFVGFVEHGDDVFRGDVAHDVVHLIEHETGIFAEDAGQKAHVLTHLFGRLEAENLLRVAAAAPEADLVAVAILERIRLHVVCGDLHRIQHVDAGLDEIRDERLDGSAGVQEYLLVGIFVDEIAELLK